MKRIITATFESNRILEKPDEMKGNPAVKTYMSEQGWKFTGTCNCSGMFTMKFELIHASLGKFEIKTRATSFLYRGPKDSVFTKLKIDSLRGKVNEVTERINEIDTQA